VLKGNHGEVTTAVAYWVDDCLGDAPPETREVEKRHGRIELREYWWVAAAELAPYVVEAFGWQALKLCGRVRRRRRFTYETDWSHDETNYVIFGTRWEVLPPTRQCSHWLRHHWAIENRGFWVLDVTYGEDRNHARKIALPLSKIRRTAINLLRLHGFRFIPDGQRVAAARTDRGLSWLL
jgi:hypothetical protein